MLAIIIALVPPDAAAHHVVYALVPQGYSVGYPPPTGPTNLVRVRIDGDRLGRVVTLATMPGVGGHISVTAGGRFVLWTTTDNGLCRLGIFDTVVQVNNLSPCSETAPLADPLRERVIVSAGNGLTVFDASGLTPIPNTRGLNPHAMSTDGERLFALRAVNNAVDLEAVDVSTGSVSWSIPLGVSTFKVVNEDESLVFVTANNSRVLRALDADSGAVVHEMAMPDPGNSFLLPGDGQTVVDTGRQRLVMALSYMAGFNPPTGAYWTVDIGTWTEVSRVSVPGPPRLARGRTSGEIFGTAQQYPKTPYCYTCTGSDLCPRHPGNRRDRAAGPDPGRPLRLVGRGVRSDCASSCNPPLLRRRV